MYTLNYDNLGNVSSISRSSDNASIPLNTDNRDYVAFLAWNALQEPPLSLDPITVQVVKSDAQLIADFLSFGTPEERGTLWATVVRTFGLTSDVSRAQFDADPATFLANPVINDMVTPRILQGVRANPELLITVLDAVEITYDPYVS